MKSGSLARLGEAGLLKLLTGCWPKKGGAVMTGIGDDCAVLRVGQRNILFKTDIVVEGIHFSPKTPSRLIGRKALARAVSDIAAMGGSPLAAVITLGLPEKEAPLRLAGIYRGMEAAAREYKVALVGGETTRAAELFLNIAVLGECETPILRSTAKAGDLLYVTGQLGGTQAKHHLTFTPRLAEGRWLAKNRVATAMMDLSDGLGADLPRLGKASELGYAVDRQAIPRRRGASVEAAIGDGEDYELLFTVAPERAVWLKKKWPFDTPLHCIGLMRRGPSTALSHGFDHFEQRRSRAGLR